MQMKEMLRKAFALGWGAVALTKEAAEKLVDEADKLVDELVKKGEVSREEARELVNDLLERGKKKREEKAAAFRQEVAHILSEMNLPSKDDLLRLEEKIDRLLMQCGDKSQG
jgi:polyhydroxyalkanoate synthesis regulator phasin